MYVYTPQMTLKDTQVTVFGLEILITCLILTQMYYVLHFVAAWCRQ